MPCRVEPRPAGKEPTERRQSINEGPGKTEADDYHELTLYMRRSNKGQKKDNSFLRIGIRIVLYFVLHVLKVK